MKKLFLFSTLAVGAFLCVMPFSGDPPDQWGLSRAAAAARPAGPPPPASLSKIPLQFIPNAGQADEKADFYVQGQDKTVYFSREGLTFVLGGDRPDRWAVKLDFVDPSKDAKPVGLDVSGAVVSYFTGPREDWKVGLPAYSRIAYRELWPGIDLIYSGTFDRMKYEFVVRPGADPARIRLVYRGAAGVRLTGDGRLAVETPAGGFEDGKPVAYQEIGETRLDVTAAYALAGNAPATFTYGFEIGAYDRSRTLVLDPVILVYCGFIGGSGKDAAHGMAVTNTGILVAGETSSSDLSFPATAGPFSTYAGGASDAFVAKINETGTVLEFCAFIGGSGLDRAAAVAEGGVIVGSTDSPEATFPVTVGPDLTYNGGASDAFVAKVNETGTALEYCGYIGGAGLDRAEAVAVDFNGGVHIAGSTGSTEATFPVTVGPDLTYNGGDSDAFVAGLGPLGQGLAYCGYVGGAGTDEALAIACQGPFIWGETSALVYLAGRTSSTEATFPVAVGPDLTYNGGDSDAFVARLSSPAATLDICGYIGGDGEEGASGLACAVEGDYFSRAPAVYVTGATSSTEATFPVTAGPDLTYNGGASDAFVVKMVGPEMAKVYCGYIGGDGADSGSEIACYSYVVYSGGYIVFPVTYSDAYVAGSTSSTEATFPVTVGPDLTYNGGASDTFIAKLDAVRLVYCGYIGGSGQDGADGLAVISDQENLDKVYVAGFSDSTEATFPVAAGPDLTFNGGASDAFVARIGPVRPVLTSLSPSSATAGGPELVLTVRGSDFLEGAQVDFDRPSADDPSYIPPATTFVSSTELQAVIRPESIAQAHQALVTVSNPGDPSSDALVFYVANAIPSLTALSPARATGGGAGFNLVVTGSNFVPDARVLWNGAAKATTFVSATELHAAIASSDLAAGGDIPVVVINPETGGTSSNVVSFAVSGFAISGPPASAKVAPGQTATYDIRLTPQFGSFDGEVSFACADLPPHCRAAFAPATVRPGASSASTMLFLSTQESTPSVAGLSSPAEAPSPPAWLPVVALPLLWLFCRGPLQNVIRRRRLAVAALVLLLAFVGGCATNGGVSPDKTPPGTYTVTVRGASGTMSASTTVTLVVQ